MDVNAVVEGEEEGEEEEDVTARARDRRGLRLGWVMFVRGRWGKT